MHWYLEPWRKYLQYEGRARRLEYWSFNLGNLLIYLVLAWLGSTGLDAAFMVYGLLALAALIPGIMVGIRRLHDTGRTGWWLLISLVPLVGAIILLVFLLFDSEPGSNEYGPNPKEAEPARTAA